MGALGANWFGTNAGRKYPLSDAATGEGVGGSLPSDLLADAYLAFPSDLGAAAFVAAARVTPLLVTVTFCSDDLVPLAAVSLPAADAVPGRSYPVVPLADGVGGWVVFGHGVGTPCGLSTADPAATALADRAVRAYRPPPVTAVAKAGVAETLTGDVGLLAGQDVEIVTEPREIDGETVEAVVIRLVSTSDRNTLDLYRGRCSGRPESGTCLEPAVETLAGIEPDCDGNIDIEFPDDCVTALPAEDGDGEPSGLALEFCLGLDDVCGPGEDLPQDGRLPREGTSYCDAGTVDASHVPAAAHFTTATGTFVEGEEGMTAPAEGAAVAVWTTASAGGRFAAEFRTPAGPVLAGGVVFGYRAIEAGAQYFLVEARSPDDEIRVLFWTGSQFVESAAFPIDPLTAETDYRLEVDVAVAAPFAITFRLIEGPGEDPQALGEWEYEAASASPSPGDKAGFGVSDGESTLFTLFERVTL
jgi:hypothetical protein